MNDLKVNSDAFERAHTCAIQLRALLVHCVGEGGESFRSLNETMQDNYLWLACDLVEEIETTLGGAQTRGDVEEMSETHRAQHEPGADRSVLVSITADAAGDLNTEVNIRQEDVDSVTDALCLALLKARQAQAEQG